MAHPKLSARQMEDMIEVGNIGAGNAASRLSDAIRHRCIINIPQASYLAVPAVKKILDMDESYVVTLHIKIMGDIPALMFVIMRRNDAQLLVKYMTKAGLESGGSNFDFTAQYALRQLGEVLTHSFFESINQFLMTKAKYAMPQISMDTWEAALDTILGDLGKPNDEHLVIHSTFFDPEKTFEGRFVYILNPESQQVMLSRIQLLLGKSSK